MKTPCPTEDRLSAYALGELPAEAAEALRAHLAECADCRREVAEQESVVATLRAVFAADAAQPRLAPARKSQALAACPPHPVVRWFVTARPALRVAAALVVMAGCLILFLSYQASAPLRSAMFLYPSERGIICQLSNQSGAIESDEQPSPMLCAPAASDEDSSDDTPLSEATIDVSRPVQSATIPAESYPRKAHSPAQSPVVLRGVFGAGKAATLGSHAGGGEAGMAAPPAAVAPPAPADPFAGDVAVSYDKDAGDRVSEPSGEDAMAEPREREGKVRVVKRERGSATSERLAAASREVLAELAPDSTADKLDAAPRDAMRQGAKPANGPVGGQARADHDESWREKAKAPAINGLDGTRSPELPKPAPESRRELGELKKTDAPPPAAPRAPAAHHPFVETAAQPLSTFAIDVDTASYTLTRQALLVGQLPDPELVRTEEIVNAFDYGDRAPERATFRIAVEGAPSPFGAGLQLARIGVKGRRLGREEQRPAMLTFLVDTSGSMDQPDRIGLARQALALLLEQLAPADRLQLLTYDNHARVLLAPTPASARADILAAFDRLQCTGSTNLEEGMRQAYRQAARAFVPGGENRVILISDGVANLGSGEASDILAQIDAHRRQGITCSVYGVGRGAYNDRMLEELANRGDGSYRFLDSAAEVRRAFVDDLAASLNTIATDVKIQVEWRPEAVTRYRQLGYENRVLTAQQFRDDAVDAGEVGSGQSVTALYELAPVAAPFKPGQPLGMVRVRYRRVDTRAVEEIELPILPEQFARTPDAARPEFRLAAGAAEFAEILRLSPHAAGSRLGEVVRLLRPVALELKLDTRVAELARLAEMAEGIAK